MDRHQQFWQQFTQTGDPKKYLAYKQSRVEVDVKKRHANN